MSYKVYSLSFSLNEFKASYRIGFKLQLQVKLHELELSEKHSTIFKLSSVISKISPKLIFLGSLTNLIPPFLPLVESIKSFFDNL